MITLSKRPFFSLVIPCYNDGRYAQGNYLDRLLNSLLSQRIGKSDMEIIIVDDHSPVSYKDIIDAYKDSLNIKYVETDYNYGPGNTRQRGAEVATGEWLCFADHDDKFYSRSLGIVRKQIKEYNEQYIVFSNFNKVEISEKGKPRVIETFKYSQLGTWVHGKFYNLDNFWKKFNLHFIKDLKTHEDIALGKMVECALHNLGRNPLYISDNIYMWIYSKESVSHSRYITEVDAAGVSHPFIETHFKDFMKAQIDPLIDSYKQGIISRDEAIILVTSALSACWLTLCEFKRTNRNGYLKENDKYASEIWNQFKQELKVDLPGIKVIFKTSFKDIMAQADDLAINQWNLPTLLEWLAEIDKQEGNKEPEKVLFGSQYNKKPLDYSIKPKKKKPKADEEYYHRPFFSIIIPCYNDGRYAEGVYLDRLLDSLTRQGVPAEDVEVILSDDCSPVPFFDEMEKKYGDEHFTLKYIKTDYNFAPGNTRAKGVTIATGKWLAFADHDDIYYDDALKKVHKAILDKNEQHYIFGDFNGVDPQGNVLRKYECVMNWCHGKFYNRDNLWDKYNIHFIPDLKSHEDIAICTQVSCVLSSAVKDYTYIHSTLYAWTDNPQSVSHAKYTVDTESGPREFLEVFYEDYITSTGYIYLEQFKKHTIPITAAIKGTLEIICYCYFYMQGFEFRRPQDFYRKNLKIGGDYVSEVKEAFNLTNKQIYDAVAADNATMYYRIRPLADPGSGRYIPTQTFDQWLDLVAPDVE